MLKRRRDNGEAESSPATGGGDKENEDEPFRPTEGKRPKSLAAEDRPQESNKNFLAGDTTEPEGTRSRGSRGRQFKKIDNLSDNDEKPELRSQKSLDGEDSASDKGSLMEETSSHLYQELLDAVLKMKDANGRLICELFLKLPPRQQYPEYYKVIKEPIDLKMIYSQMKSNAYLSLDDIEKDLLLLVKNAHAFNEPGSQVYKDATAIKRTVSAKKQEIEHMLSGAKSSKRLRSKRSTSKMNSAINALLSDTDDEEEMQADSSLLADEEDYDKNNELLDDDADDPFLALYKSVRKYSDYSGRIISEAFMKLPSKRAYPDYYEVIKNPIGLLKIGTNIKNGFYGSLDALSADMDRCFENAKAYNETESMLYQDAVTLQDILRSRKIDIEKISLEKGIALTRPVKKSAKIIGDPGQGDEPDAESKELLAHSKPSNKKSGKKPAMSESEANLLKKRMREMYDAVESYQDENGRYLSQLFVELPSAAQYPDYYEIISEPTCLRMIDKNIRDGKYTTEQQFLLDFEIMFENAKHYNEIGSQVHVDALTLDKVLKKKRKSLGRFVLGQPDGSSPGPSVKQTTPGSKQQTTPTKSTRSGSSTKSSHATTTTDVKELCKELYHSVQDYTDSTGRYLCGIFQKLPSKNDYPDYYSLIKRPIDMAKILTKVHAEQYSSLEECFQDFVLMFDNACKYNDPDSQVYKDSLVLLRELLATKLELLGDCELHVPNIPDLVRKIIEELYEAVIQHQDDEGRCYTDSLIKLPNSELVEENGQKKKVLSLPTIGKLVKKGYYKRLDRFQEDLFTFFEKARTGSVDSEVYDDAVELQQSFVQQRDRVCKDGERFVSPAISLTKRHLTHELDEERKRKMKEEAGQLGGESNKEIAKDTEQANVTNLSEVKVGDQDIAVGDYVYVDSRDGFIVAVEKIWMDKKEAKWIRGTWFLRPEQTIHDPTRKFMEKEVLRSDKTDAVSVDHIKGLCYVMHVKNYGKTKSLGFDDSDTYVCECAYNTRRQLFKKLRSWPSHHSVKHITREKPLLLHRAPLSGEKGNEKDGSIKDGDEELISSLLQTRQERKNLQIDVPNPNPEGFTNYEQYWVDSGCYKLGDTVYTQTDESYWTISRIDKIWSDRQGATYFCGTTFIKPDDTQHLPTHMFYDKEVFHVATEEVHRLTDIMGKCFVLPIREYMRCRPTDVLEEHVYLCESRYEEDEGGHFRKLKGLKRPTLSASVYEEEFYFFEENLNLVKKPSPLLVKDLSNLKRDDRVPSPALGNSEAESGKSVKKKSRPQSGFLLFSTERRGILHKQHPEYGFGDISRLIGSEWKNLSPAKREEWETRAAYQASVKSSSAVTSPVYSGAGIAYECLWQGCDYQYEDQNELIIHVLESGGHLIKLENGICPCAWRNCERLRRGFRPFNSLTKLIRHCREMHLKGPPRRVEFHERSKNYFPKNQAPHQPEVTLPGPVSANQPQQNGNHTYVGVVPSPTPSHVLGSSQSVNINANLIDQQYSNVMRLPTPGLAQTMMGLSTSYGSQGVASQNSTNIQRAGAMVSGSAPIPTMNQFGQLPNIAGSVAQQQFVNSMQQLTSAYQQPPTQDLQQVNQLPPPYPNMQVVQQPQQPTHSAQPRQAASMQADQRQQNQQGIFPAQRTQFVDSQPTESQMTPLFHSPPPRQQKLLHSDAYLRYIEGLRDGTPHLSNWNPNKPDLSKMTPQQQAQLPAQWLGTAYNPHSTTVDALWALREHMLNDALKLSKFTQSYS